MRQRQNSCVISIRSFAPFPLAWRFRLCPSHCCNGRAGFGRYPSRPASRWERPGCVMTLCTGLRKLLDQKRCVLSVRPIACRERLSPHSPFVLTIRCSAAPASTFLTSSSKPFCPLSRYRPELQTLFQPLREYGRLMGSDSHPRILRLSPLISRRIDYLHRSRIFRHNHC